MGTINYPASYLDMPEAERRDLYRIGVEAHDAGAECAMAWVVSQLRKVAGTFVPGSAGAQLDSVRASGVAVFIKHLTAQLEKPGAGLHDHDPFERFDREMRNGSVHMPGAQPAEPEDEKPAPFIGKHVRE